VRWQIAFAALWLAAVVSAVYASAQEAEELLPTYWQFSAANLSALPPLLASGGGFQDSTTKPIERRARVRWFDRSLQLKTAYQERKLWSAPLAGAAQKNSIYSLHAATDLLTSLLSGEAEIAYNAFDRNGAEQIGRAMARLFRIALKGDWRGYRYGAEYRSVDKGFMSFKGGPAWRSEAQARFWSEKNFGPLRLRAGLSQLWENLNESRATPRLTRSSSLSLVLHKGSWETALTSVYSYRADRFDGGSAADLIAHELRLTWQPLRGMRISPIMRYTSEANRRGGVGSLARSAGFSLAYQPSRNTLSFVGDTSYHWLRTGDRLTNARDLRSALKLTWHFGDSIKVRPSLTYEISYSRHLDRVLPVNSNSAWATKLLLTIYKF